MGFCDAVDIENFRVNGHHWVRTPDGFEEDFCSAIGEYIARCEGDFSKCDDVDGAEILDVTGTVGDLTVKYGVYEHHFVSGKVVDGEYTAHGKLVERAEGDIIFIIDDIDHRFVPTMKETKKHSKEIIDRWNQRIVPNGWDKSKAGAGEYLKKYGKGISVEKMQAFSDYAFEVNAFDFSLGMEEAIQAATVNIPIWKEYTPQEAAAENFHEDILEGQKVNIGLGYESKIVMATAKELADMKIGSVCGNVGNTCFIQIAKKYPNLKIRGCLDLTNKAMGSCEFFIKSDSQGKAISRLADDGDGSYRFDGEDCDLKNEWAYFESE